ncbi:MAG: hypothetical protein HY682_12750, partial [Chloroflexi bacterium]|nr:hypothetical protein [Chloroflexota bacterium]
MPARQIVIGIAGLAALCLMALTAVTMARAGILQSVTTDTWYLAEGYTGTGFDTFILIQNPNNSQATVQVTYMLQGGGTVVRDHTVAANSRYTIVAKDAGEVGPDKAFSTKLVSDRVIIVERAMYWPEGGHDTAGVTAPADTWYLAEGYTGGDFETFILLQNPNSSAATVQVTYMLQGGGTILRTHAVPANSRYTIVAGESGQVGRNKAFSTKVVSDMPVIVERAMYWDKGGHVTVGVARTLPVPTATPAPAALAGTIVGAADFIGSAIGTPRFDYFQSFDSKVGVIEPLVKAVWSDSTKSDLVAEPLLAESWTIDPTLKFMDFKIKKGVQFHGGWGEMTAEDVAWSY